MVTKTIDAQKTNISVKELMAELRDGIEIILAEGDKPVARVLPVTVSGKKRIAGLNEGSTWVSDDFDDPLPDEFWLGDDA